jgi:two-component system chemotaxis response regulator CheY
MRVLIVDDSERIRLMVAAVLQAVGCSVVTAANGLSGLAQFRAHAPDAIVTDINMPVMDGLTFVSQVRDQPGGRALPIFVLSSDDCPAKRARAHAYGVNRWMEKPTDLAAMASAVMQSAA